MKKLFRKMYEHLNRPYTTGYFWKLREQTLSGKGLLRYYYQYRYLKTLRKHGASIPLQTQFADMPMFPHGINGIFISMGAKIGTGCTIFHQVTIGSNTLSDSKRPGAPIIGNNVFIGAGAKIIGGVRIGDNVRIGANCVVATDIPDNCTVVLPVPKVIAHEGPRDNHFAKWGEYAEN